MNKALDLIPKDPWKASLSGDHKKGIDSKAVPGFDTEALTCGDLNTPLQIVTNACRQNRGQSRCDKEVVAVRGLSDQDF